MNFFMLLQPTCRLEKSISIGKTSKMHRAQSCLVEAHWVEIARQSNPMLSSLRAFLRDCGTC